MLPHWSAPPICRSTPVRAVQVQEVGRLEGLVAELGEAHARGEARLDGVLGEHVGHREVLADVAQEVEDGHRASQSRLSTMSGCAGPGEKSRKRSSCRRSAAELASIVASSRRLRSVDLPDGSPIMPVPPPMTMTGRPPARCRWSEQEDLQQVADVERAWRSRRSRCSR